MGDRKAPSYLFCPEKIILNQNQVLAAQEGQSNILTCG